MNTRVKHVFEFRVPDIQLASESHEMNSVDSDIVMIMSRASTYTRKS